MRKMYRERRRDRWPRHFDTRGRLGTYLRDVLEAQLARAEGESEDEWTQRLIGSAVEGMKPAQGIPVAQIWADAI